MRKLVIGIIIYFIGLYKEASQEYSHRNAHIIFSSDFTEEMKKDYLLSRRRSKNS